MANQIHNLDEGVQEYFEFILKGHKYRFAHLNTEQLEELQKISDSDEDKQKDFFYKFITKVDDSSPDFADISKQMIAPHWIRFRKMVETEFSGGTA